MSGCVQLAAVVEGVNYASLGPHTDKLHVFPWQIYPDMVVFDWLIRLGDKDRYELNFWLNLCLDFIRSACKFKQCKG